MSRLGRLVRPFFRRLALSLALGRTFLADYIALFVVVPPCCLSQHHGPVACAIVIRTGTLYFWKVEAPRNRAEGSNDTNRRG